jgi:hypothetical protein
VVQASIGWIVSAGDKVINRVMIHRADLHLNGASNQLWGLVFLHILKGSSLIEMTTSICEHTLYVSAHSSDWGLNLQSSESVPIVLSQVSPKSVNNGGMSKSWHLPPLMCLKKMINFK